MRREILGVAALVETRVASDLAVEVRVELGGLVHVVQVGGANCRVIRRLEDRFGHRGRVGGRCRGG